MFEISAIKIAGTTVSNWDAAASVFDKMLSGALADGMLDAAVSLEMTLKRIGAQLEQKHGGQWPLSGDIWGTVPDRLSRRTGAGLQSILDSIKTDIDGATLNVEGRISTAGLSVHEAGAVIIPSKSRFLALPLRAALDARGIPLKPDPSAWTNTFVKRSARGNLIIFRKDGKTITPLYLLAGRATIPPRLRMEETVNANLSYFQNKVLVAFEQRFLQ